MSGNGRHDVERDKKPASYRPDELPEPVRAALADPEFMKGVREAVDETEPPVPLRQLQDREGIERAQRRV